MASSLHERAAAFFQSDRHALAAEEAFHGIDQQHAGVVDVVGFADGDDQIEHGAGGADFPIGGLVRALQMVGGEQAGHELQDHDERFGAFRAQQEDGRQAFRFSLPRRSTGTDIAMRFCCNRVMCSWFSAHAFAACSASSSRQYLPISSETATRCSAAAAKLSGGSAAK